MKRPVSTSLSDIIFASLNGSMAALFCGDPRMFFLGVWIILILFEINHGNNK